MLDWSRLHFVNYSLCDRPYFLLLIQQVIVGKSVLLFLVDFDHHSNEHVEKEHIEKDND